MRQSTKEEITAQKMSPKRVNYWVNTTLRMLGAPLRLGLAESSWLGSQEPNLNGNPDVLRVPAGRRALLAGRGKPSTGQADPQVTALEHRPHPSYT